MGLEWGLTLKSRSSTSRPPHRDKIVWFSCYLSMNLTFNRCTVIIFKAEWSHTYAIFRTYFWLLSDKEKVCSHVYFIHICICRLFVWDIPCVVFEQDIVRCADFRTPCPLVVQTSSVHSCFNGTPAYSASSRYRQLKVIVFVWSP